MSDVVIAPLDQADDRLLALTYPRFRPMITASDASIPVRALAAWRNGEPVGLALLAATVEPGTWRVLSIAVARPWRRQGIGLALLRAVETWAAGQGHRALVAHHNDRMGGLDAWLGLLRRAQWPEPAWTFMRLFGPVTWAQEAATEWQGLLGRLAASGFEATAWEDRSEADKTAIDILLADAPPGFNPQWAEPILAGPSIVIREHGQVVGLVLATEGAEKGTVYYPIGFVVPRLQRSGWLMGGLVEACLRQARLRGNGGVSCFQTAADNHAMQAVMRRRLDKWTLRRDCQFETRKSLND